MDIILNTISLLTINDILDILIVTFSIYKCLMLIKETRAETLIKGVIFILISWKIAEIAQFRMLQFLLKNLLTMGIFALLVLFQPELRRALEFIGRGKFSKSLLNSDDEFYEKIDYIVTACDDMSKTKTGALIVIEREIGLNEIINTGTNIDAIISDSLIKNIFFKNSPLHDGALIIKKGKISAAGCILPLTQNTSVNKDLGTRHRAALGVIEKSDAIVIVVSEETGVISICCDNQISRYLDKNSLSSILKSKFKISKKNQNLLINFWKKNNEGAK